MSQLFRLDAHSHQTTFASSQSADDLSALVVLMSDRGLPAHSVQEIEGVVNSVGWHPWKTHMLSLESSLPSKFEHYSSILQRDKTHDAITEAETDILPQPILFSDEMQKMRDYILENPAAIVGEIGIDLSYRIHVPEQANPSVRKMVQHRSSLKHQLDIMQAQLELAYEFDRPVSMHAVKSSRIIVDFLLRHLSLENPKSCKRIHMHGCALSAEEITSLYKSETARERIWMSFLARPATRKQILAVPDNKILVESDSEGTFDVALEALNENFKTVAEVKQWEIYQAEVQIKRNFAEFLAKEI